MEKNNELPKNWILTTVDKVGEITTGNTPPKNDQSNYGDYLPWVKPPQLDNNAPIVDTPEKLSKKGSLLARTLDKESILISCIGDLGKIGIAGTKLATNQQINAVTFFNIVEPKFGYYFFKSTIFSNWLENNKSATVISIINKGRFSKAPFILSPPNEQKRIVAKIEELFSETKKIVDLLNELQKQITSYKKSFRNLAFSGKLTEKWRKNNSSTIKKELEHAQKILEKKIRLLGENLEIKKIGEWNLVPFKLLFDEAKNGLSKRHSKEGILTPVIRLVDIKNGKIGKNQFREIKLTEKERCKYLLDYNNLLCIRVNGSENLVGRMIVCQSDREWAFSDHMISYKPQVSLILSSYISEFFNTKEIRDYIRFNKVSSAGQNTVSQATLAKILVPLPSLSEQKIIMNEFESHFSVLDNFMNMVIYCQQKTSLLQNSILKLAFEGKLVPQDPNDEPASELLKRIKN